MVCGESVEDGDSVLEGLIWCVECGGWRYCVGRMHMMCGECEGWKSCVGRINMVCGVWRMEIMCGKDEYGVWGGWG